MKTRHKCVDANKTFAVTRAVTEDGPATEKYPAPAGDATSDAKTPGAKTHDAPTPDEDDKATPDKAPAATLHGPSGHSHCHPADAATSSAAGTRPRGKDFFKPTKRPRFNDDNDDDDDDDDDDD